MHDWLVPDWLVPDWPAPPNVRALQTTRAGGVSSGLYASLNLGDHVGDAPEAVARNRALLARALGATPVLLRQVHGTRVATLPDREAVPEADACLTTQRALVCTIMTADCLPVLLCDERGRAVAAAHAGWRGLANGVLERSVVALRAAAHGAAPTRLLAWLGPCIGPQAFEVGDEVRAAFVAHDGAASACFQPLRPGKWLADLPALARQRLRAVGVTQLHGNDGSAGWCTVSDSSRFFSHRRDRVSGRLASCIWRV